MLCKLLEARITAAECEQIQQERGEEGCVECPFFIPFERFMLEEQERHEFIEQERK